MVDTSGGELRRLAFVVDAREAQFLAAFGPAWERLERAEHALSLIFLDADDEVLVKRFKETRRRHPQDSGGGVREGIAKERALLEDLRNRADQVIDSSQLSVHELKRRITERFAGEESPSLLLTLMSFGFKYGLPPELDLCLDARFLPNPFFVEELRPRTGRDQDVAHYVLSQPDAEPFVERVLDLVGFLLPRYHAEGKAYVTLAIGCTGGRHRSVALVEEMSRRLADGTLDIRVDHRDVKKLG
jgi:UPF0042 nucleotide-binding protein